MSDHKKKYETERIRELRLRELSKYEEGLLNTVEEFRCMVLSVQDPNENRPSFSYTIGLNNTRQVPEIITCGLSANAAHAALNHAANLLAAGVNLTTGRHIDLIGNVEVEFRPVDPKWTKILMLSAVWFNGNSEFPALQLIFPDLENRFPEEEGFNADFDQPLLQPDAKMRQIDKDFWSAHVPKKRRFH